MYQDFDASEFDYLNSTTPQQFEQQTKTQTPEVTNIERFWNLTGNWGEFGSYFGAGLSASLIVRAIPALIPAAVILIPAAGLGLALYSLSAEGGWQSSIAIDTTGDRDCLVIRKLGCLAGVGCG